MRNALLLFYARRFFVFPQNFLFDARGERKFMRDPDCDDDGMRVEREGRSGSMEDGLELIGHLGSGFAAEAAPGKTERRAVTIIAVSRGGRLLFWTTGECRVTLTAISVPTNPNSGLCVKPTRPRPARTSRSPE